MCLKIGLREISVPTRLMKYCGYLWCHGINAINISLSRIGFTLVKFTGRPHEDPVIPINTLPGDVFLSFP